VVVPTLIGLHIFPIDALFEGAGCRKHGQILSTDTLLVDPVLSLPTRSASAAFREEFYLEPTLRFPLQVQQQQHKNLCIPWSFVSSFFPEIVLLYSPCCGRGKNNSIVSPSTIMAQSAYACRDGGDNDVNSHTRRRRLPFT
jgi:hypothetical protein